MGQDGRLNIQTSVWMAENKSMKSLKNTLYGRVECVMGQVPRARDSIPGSRAKCQWTVNETQMSRPPL